MSNVVIDIAAEFTGKKAFKQADTASDKLSKSVKSLAKTLGVAFSVTAVVAFGKASMKAFAEDEAAASRLTKAVENLGLGFEDARIKTFISDLEKTAGVADDVLRPAFQSLLNTTGSVAKSQELLTLALDVSAGSGVDAAQVSKDLSLAYLGQTKGLSKYNLGLTKTELQTVGFTKIQEKLNEQFAGQNATRLTTYAGKMELLKVAAGNAQEIIGKGLVDALSDLGDDNSINGLATSMENVATKTADVIRGIGVLIAKVKTIPGFNSDFGVLYDISYFALLEKMGKAAGIKPKPFSTPMTISASSDASVKEDNARKAAEAEAKKRAAELLAMQKKTLKSQQDNLKLTKAKAIFDLKKIQIEAALKGKLSEEDRIRLLLMKAIEDENISQIEKYTKLLDDAQRNTEKLVSTLQGIKPLDDIFKNFNFMSVKEQLASLTTYFNNFAGSAASAFNALNRQQQAALGGFEPFVGASIPSVSATNPSMPSTVGLGATGTGNQLPAGVTINVNTGIGDPNAIAEAIDEVLTNARNRGTLVGGLFAV
jgi:hypothetical protein